MFTGLKSVIAAPNEVDHLVYLCTTQKCVFLPPSSSAGRTDEWHLQKHRCCQMRRLLLLPPVEKPVHLHSPGGEGGGGKGLLRDANPVLRKHQKTAMSTLRRSPASGRSRRCNNTPQKSFSFSAFWRSSGSRTKLLSSGDLSCGLHGGGDPLIFLVGGDIQTVKENLINSPQTVKSAFCFMWGYPNL